MACWVFAKLADGAEDIHALLVTSGVIELCIAALRAHPSHAGVQGGVFMALGNLAFDEPVRTRLVSVGVIKAAVAALAAFVADEEAAERICRALGTFTNNSADNGAQAAAAGVFAAAVSALRTHPAVRVHSVACDLFSIIMSDPAHRAAALDAGVVDAVLQSMRLHPGDADVVLSGCACLHKILPGTEDSHVTAALADAAAAVLAALRAHPAVEELQLSAYMALKTITEGGQSHAVACGGIEQAVATLRAPGSEHVHSRACSALAAMCYNVPEHEVRGAAAGSFEAAVGVMRANPAVERAQLAGCTAVCALVSSSYDPRQQIKAAIAGAVEALVAALRGAQSGELQAIACFTLYALSVNNKGIQTRARGAGALDAIATALAGEATGDADEQRNRFEAGVTALSELMAGEEDWAVRAGAVEALQKHAATARPECACPRLLANLQPATHRHDANPCTHASCRRCAGMRARGLMCALAGCGICKREGGKRLQRCITCRSARYCSPAHQHEDWQRHRLECAGSSAGDD